MNIDLPLNLIKPILTDAQKASEIWLRRIRYKSPNDNVDFNCEILTDDQLTALAEKLKATEGYRGMANKVTAYFNIRSDTKHEKPIKKLSLLETALVAYIGKLPNKWLYVTGKDGKLCPCYVNKVSYQPSEPRTGQDARTTVELYYVRRDEKQSQSIYWGQEDLKNGMTVVQLLAEEGYLAETDTLNAAHAVEMQYYADINHNTGHQYLASGTGYTADSYRFAYELAEMVRDGEPAKVIMDDDDSEGLIQQGRSRDGVHITSQFWDDKKKGKESDDDEADSEEGMVVLPTHPYVKVFDLRQHEFVNIHVTNLKEYVYDKTLINKLVLPQNQKDLVSILIASSNVVLEDIVRGKTGGVVVIGTGAPGVGKTLTAEVTAEHIERPLYCVQCSQLGTDEETLEKKLQTVLTRASRWKAVLLIDEADVYVHERGTDIQQNAIVGVFLRLLEYYRGIMFMTSNRAVVIDDAIMSRATAWIRYNIPDVEALPQIWRVLAAQYQVELTDADVEILTANYLGVSGRTVKNLLKMARLLSASDKKLVTVERIDYCSKFINVEELKSAAIKLATAKLPPGRTLP